MNPVRFEFRCVECGRTYTEKPGLLLCVGCSAKQEPGGPTRGVLEVVMGGLPGSWPKGNNWLDWLPLGTAGPLPGFPVGGTPLLAAPRLAAKVGVHHVWVKDDTRNPSGSTKDRASFLVVAKALEYGRDTIAVASTGNAATALAAAVAPVGLRALAFVPATAPDAKLVQMMSYGAELVPVDGSYDDAFELCVTACREFGWYNRNTAMNPFTIEGKKTLALETGAQMASSGGADVVLVPTGDGVILSGVAKGYRDLVRAGLLEKSPRLLAVQPERSAALATALCNGEDTVRRLTKADSVADSLNVETPRNAVQCLAEVRATGGAGVIVSDDEILAAIPLLAGTTGVFAEPAGATAVAGLIRALDQGLVTPEERVVIAVTGTGLKDIPAAARVLVRPEPIEPTLEALRRRMNLP